ncbi:MAG TPA: hypothetical protein VN734_03150 [Acidobacteriaceae bacterium]|nr:hypothetical protein [Acidobacteriaceae bacterium]
MPPLSATDAISPAWQHARRLLLGPRDPRLFFKIAAVAFFAELANFSFSFSSPGHSNHGGGHPPAFTAAILAIIFTCVVVGLIVGAVLFYLSSRLQLTLFHVVLRSDTTVAPIWRRYGPATWRWMGLKLLFFLAALACITPIAIPAVFYFIHTISLQSHGGSSHIVSFILTMFAFVAVIFLFAVTVAAVTILLRDFAVPSMALEGTPLRETVRRVIALTRAETGQVALYVLLRVCLGIAGTFVSYLLLGVLALIVGAPLGGLGFGLWKEFHLAGAGAHAGMIAGWVILALALLTVLAVGVISLFGYLFTFLQAYAIFFLGGRYPLMGQLLTEPTAPVLPSPRPQAWTPAFHTPPPA